MEEKISFEKDNFCQKNPKHLQKNVFIIYSPRAVKVEPATNIKIYTKMTVFIPQNLKGFLTSILRGNKINELSYGKHHLWVEVLDKFFDGTVEIKKNQPLVFLVVEPKNLKFHHVLSKKRKQKENISIQTEDEKGNLEVFLVGMILPMLGEML